MSSGAIGVEVDNRFSPSVHHSMVEANCLVDSWALKARSRYHCAISSRVFSPSPTLATTSFIESPSSAIIALSASSR
eukprot:CAMPEP_0198298138 /NCGR_PEP_ID=MMETSP1449-20131203/39785_1 /TAXON_ID=420275 /ORGANISM="Attheya septentrionalis, Strain CCMP2084" /LENGTH=76 /DNA_ID=CAMNT_0043999325 /DNA_START=103 /DNA_END=333 /DNA_ORIENTATION=-